MQKPVDMDVMRAELLGSFLLFCQIFFPLITGRQYIISRPMGRESHMIVIARELTKCARLETPSLLINCPPGSGQSVLMCMFVAWTMARYPDSQYLYISYSSLLSAKHTAFIKRIFECSAYQQLFNIKLRQDSKAKDFFSTNHGGVVKAFGSASSITGNDGGLPSLDRFSGAVICDDLTRPDDSHSTNIRESIQRNYQETILQRLRGPNVPIICIAQRLHEDDICAYMLSGKDERVYKSVILKAIDDAGNALYPEVNPIEQLLEKKAKSPYVFASQYQQNPIPAGGALFKRDDFAILLEDPQMLCTFIVVDSAETASTVNDATAMTFFGVYMLADGRTLALHCIDCLECWVEPKDLRAAFEAFYFDCLRYKVPPSFAAIEKKSTGVTLCSVLKDMQGLQIRDIQRTKASGSKTARFLEMQPYIASKLISFTEGMFHVEHCIEHLMKITANDSHSRDDIADNFYDGVKMALIDKNAYCAPHAEHSSIVTKMADKFRHKMAVLNRTSNRRG